MSAPTSSSPADRLRSLSRRSPSMSERLERLHRYGWHIAQGASAAAVAWVLARHVLGHPQPFFAPVAAIVCLGLSYGQRLRRVAEVTVGVALGVLIGDAFATVFGSGVWQVLVVVALAMSLAVLLGAGPLVVTQAGVQSAIVTTLAPTVAYGVGRWLDAVCGGVVALAAAAIVPGSPLRRPRLAAASVLSDLAQWLRDGAAATREHDLDLAYRTLTSARASDAQLDDVRQAADDGLSVARSSPWQRRHRDDVLAVSALAVPMDRAVRNVRVLVRRITVVVRRGETLPTQTLALIDQLIEAVCILADDLRQHRPSDEARAELAEVGHASAGIPTGQGLSADVVLAQVRSVVVDLLELSGLPYDEALELVPTAAGGEAPAPEQT